MKKNSNISKIVKKVLREQLEDNRYKPITIDLIKEYINDNLKRHFDKEFDITNLKLRRRVKNPDFFQERIDDLAKEYYDNFIYRLDYMSEDGQWEDFISDLGLYD